MAVGPLSSFVKWCQTPRPGPVLKWRDPFAEKQVTTLSKALAHHDVIIHAVANTVTNKGSYVRCMAVPRLHNNIRGALGRCKHLSFLLSCQQYSYNHATSTACFGSFVSTTRWLRAVPGSSRLALCETRWTHHDTAACP